MKLFNCIKLFTVCLFPIALFNSFVYADETNIHKVIEVVDGDTLYIDLNNNGKYDKGEKVRINGIDSFETKNNARLEKQAKQYNLSETEVLSLGFLGKEFARKNLLNKYIKVEYTAKAKVDRYNRPLVSIYYSCSKNGQCKKSYEQEILKEGLAVVYPYSNLKKALRPYENIEKIRENAEKAKNLNLVVLNQANEKHYKNNKRNIQDNIKDKKLNTQSNINRNNTMKEILSNLNRDKISIYFVDPLKNKKPINEPDSEPALALLALINNAKETIDFAIYGIAEQDEIFSALVKAKERNVQVRGVTDVDQKYKNIYADTFRLISTLKNVVVDFETTKKTEEKERLFFYKNGVNMPYIQNIKFDINNKAIDKSYISKYGIEIQKGIMHDKFFIIDNKYLWTGSTNVSSGCLTYNANVSVAIDSPIIANLYKQEFEQMYLEGKFHKNKRKIENTENIQINDNTRVSVYFSPKSLVFYKAIIPLIDNAQSSIDIPIFFFTHKDVIQALLNAHARGVKIRVLLDAVGALSAYSKHDILRSAGIPVKVENWGGKMHMKSMIVDKKIILVGSTNWTNTAAHTNDENLLVIYNEHLAQVFSLEFERLYGSIPNKWLKRNPYPEGRDSKNSCTDGIDNNHNGFIDKNDYACRFYYKHKMKELNPKQLETNN